VEDIEHFLGLKPVEIKPVEVQKIKRKKVINIPA